MLLLSAWMKTGAHQGRGNVFRDDLVSVQRGQEVFNRYCAACHNFETAEIGPNLSGITSEASKKWLMAFIRNAPDVIASGDERAGRLHKQYKQFMPAFPMLSAEDLELVLAYLHTFSAGTKGPADKPGALSDPIPQRIASSNLTLALEKVLTIPASAGQPPLTRINKFLAIAHGRGERRFIHDLRGRLYEITDGTPHVYLDMAVVFPHFIHVPGLGTGFGSFAFHPDVERNGLFYTTHTEPAASARADFALTEPTPVKLQWVLVEWKADNALAATFSGAHREVLRADMYSQVHGFQELTFNPLAKPGDADYGLLYLSVGDGGAGVSKYWSSCCDRGIWGTVLRIDPAGTNSRNGKYGIPRDNPFVSDPKAAGEVWARGFRNPHRITWDITGSRKMFITNIGQQSIEEVNLGVAGGHYGWPEREGTFLVDVHANPNAVYPLPAKDSVPYAYPVAQYDHDDGNAISGGFVYGGDRIPLLRGKYVFGDIPRGRVFYSDVSRMKPGAQAPIYELAIAVDGKTTTFESLTQNTRVDLRIGQDLKGDLYIFTKADGAVWKVVDCQR